MNILMVCWAKRNKITRIVVMMVLIVMMNCDNFVLSAYNTLFLVVGKADVSIVL